MKIHGKTAVIIGGARGLGKACVEALVEKGANVFIGDVLKQDGVDTVNELAAKYGSNRVDFRYCDITNVDDITALFDAAVAKWGYVDIFSPVAGIIGEHRWHDVIKVNLNGTIQSTFEAMKRMGKDHGGRGGAIVLISSNAGYLPFPFGPVYSATKHGIMGFMRAYSDNLLTVHHGLHICCLCPFAADTAMCDLITVPEGTYLLVDDVKAFLSGGDKTLIRPKSVGDGLIRCLEDSTLHGKALSVMKKDGKDVLEVANLP